jgi:hypothetical protein
LKGCGAFSISGMGNPSPLCRNRSSKVHIPWPTSTGTTCVLSWRSPAPAG